MNTNLVKNILWTILYSVFTLFIVFHHEIWADEAQVWLLARNLSVFGLFKHLVNEGHPSFFYLLMMPFAKLNFPIFTMQIICWLSSCAAVFLLLQYSPFNRFAKFSIIISSGFLYFFPVIARSYSILPFLVFLAAILYNKSKEKPVLYAIVLAMIANTHVIMFAFVAILGLHFIYELFVKDKKYSRKNIVAAGIILLSLLAVIVQLAGTIGNNGAIAFNYSHAVLESVRVFCIFFLNTVDLVFKSSFENVHLNVFIVTTALFEAVLFILLFIQLFMLNKKYAILGATAIGFHFFIYIFSYKVMIYQTRIFSSYLILIFCFWLAFKDPELKEKIGFCSKKVVNAILGIFFLMTFLCGLKALFLDLFNNYSSAKETASFIEKNIDKNALIIPNADAFSLAVYEQLPDRKFYSLYTFREIKYMVWYVPEMYSVSDFTDLLKKNINVQKSKNTYILVSSFLDTYHLEETMSENYSLIYKSSPAIATGEAFRIYEYKPKQKEY